ncbi:aminoglycoside phosphotransferase family protein [Pedococcus sp. KACC 23699]|uniref:Aminoglycoside phosphotransferase family protein n=1 Tax=Pedococcus sp. KACC 23699 TaxID=3149228 RepID=A0AAU7JSM5_9MICO
MTHHPVPDPVIAGALAEARRRQQLSERDLTPAVTHFAATVGWVCDAWELSPRGWFDGGAAMPTLDVVRADGMPGVLKIALPGELDDAARVMIAAEGRGYARVMAWDDRAGALVSERLGTDLWTEQTGVVPQGTVVAPLLRDAWAVPLTSGRPFEGKASGLVSILADLGPRYAAGHEGALRLATTYARALAATERPEVVCHGDPHAGNVLRRGSGWALIDPDGFVGERAYDLGVVLRDACREIAAAEQTQTGSGVDVLCQGCRHLSTLTGVDEDRVWQWGFVERVTTGLYLAWHGYASEATTFLDTASLVAHHC